MSGPKKKKRKAPPEIIFSSGSMNECTGLIPVGDDLSEEEYEAYEELYPFGGDEG